MNPASINFKQIKDLDSKRLRDISQLMKIQKYSDEEGFGFIVKNEDKNHLQAYLIIDSPSFTTSFDPEKLSVTKTKIIKKIAIEFLIDLDYGVLEVYSDKNNTTRIVSELGKLSKFSFSIDDIQFKAMEILNKVKGNGCEYSIHNLRIRDFSINEYMRGSYFVNVLVKEEVERLIKEYNHSITYVGLNFSLEGYAVSIGLYDSGGVRIYGKTDEFDEILPKVKAIFFKTEK